MTSRLLIVPAVLVLAGCNTLDPVSGSVDPGFGEALRHDMVIQTIDPDPVHPDGAELPGGSGAVGAEAIKRYRTGRVNQVEMQTTTTGSSEGSGGGSGPR